LVIAHLHAKAEEKSMSALQDPRELAEAVVALRLTPKADQRLQELMDRNTNGLLSPSEREELEALAEMSESISLLRAKAFVLLGRKPA
jgi:bacterioferritin (cytochrome b1)